MGETLETSLQLIVFYPLYCGVIQGYPVLRKPWIIRHFFSHVFDIANELLSVDEWTTKPTPFSMWGRLSELFRIKTDETLKIRIAYRQRRSNFPRRGRKKKSETAYSVTLVMTFLVAESENRQLKDLPQADLGRAPERFLLSVRTNSITDNFVYWKLG